MWKQKVNFEKNEKIVRDKINVWKNIAIGLLNLPEKLKYVDINSKNIVIKMLDNKINNLEK